MASNGLAAQPLNLCGSFVAPAAVESEHSPPRLQRGKEDGAGNAISLEGQIGGTLRFYAVRAFPATAGLFGVGCCRSQLFFESRLRMTNPNTMPSATIDHSTSGESLSSPLRRLVPRMLAMAVSGRKIEASKFSRWPA